MASVSYIQGNAGANGPSVYVRVIGIPQAQTKMQAMKYMSGPMREFLIFGGEIVKKTAQDRMESGGNVYTGHTEASINIELDSMGMPMWVLIGSNDPIAEYLEEGTKPHFPNLDNITPWALDHGWDPWELAIHIADYGTQPHPFLLPGFIESIPSLAMGVEVLAKSIEAAAAA